MKRFVMASIWICMAFPSFVLAVETITEVSIKGNTELPNMRFDLSWRLPSVEKRESQSPPKKLKGMLAPLEPYRYKQQVHFSKYLEVESTRFNTR